MADAADKIAQLNGLSEVEAREALHRCCGSDRWCRAMLQARPFADLNAVYAAADRIWAGLGREDWLEAFSHHPRLGDASVLAKRFASTAAWASDEQSGARVATAPVLTALANGNVIYEQKFGFVFLLCATGKSAEEMLAALERRLPNDAKTELAIAAGEQAKIMRLRLEKWLR